MNKEFDCVEMKRKGAIILQKKNSWIEFRRRIEVLAKKQ